VVVGAGARGRHHVRTFSRLAASFDVVGVVDVEAEAAERVGAEFRVRPLALRALRGALRAKDVVVIASPIEAHVEGALLALASGCDVFVEKPLASTAREAWALVDEARRTGGRLFVGHVERFNPVVRALARRLPCETPRELTFRRVGPSTISISRRTCSAARPASCMRPAAKARRTRAGRTGRR
jgi:predicted dehydrogenase